MYGAGQFVTVGEGWTNGTSTSAILTSPDGTAWTNRNSGSLANLAAIASGQGQLVAAGVTWNEGGVMLTSADGVMWTNRPVGNVQCRRLIYADDQFVAVGSGTVLTSPDGVFWSSGHPDTALDLYGVAYGDGQFVAVGMGGTILDSLDGGYWTQCLSGTDAQLNAVAYSNGRFVAVGYGGAILQSGVVTEGTVLRFGPVTWRSNGSFGLTLRGGAGQTYTLQASTNLVDWQSLTNLVSTNGTMLFNDPGATNLNRRFYRALQP